MDPASVALWCAVPLGIALVMDAFELVVGRAQLREGGLYGYAVLATGRPVLLTGPLASPLGAIFRYPSVMALPATQIGAGLVLVAAGASQSPELERAAGIAALTALASRMLLYLRNQLGLDGSDQMILVASTSVAAALLVTNQVAQTIALGYLAVQLLLSYLVAGVAKAISPTWRSGRAIPAILSTIGYGVPRIGTFLIRHSKLGRLLCWAVIVFECGAPALILLGTPGALMIIAAGLAFHVSIAFLMGLNVFPWSFAASYPALLLVAQTTDRLWH